jgi:Terminase small subunit
MTTRRRPTTNGTTPTSTPASTVTPTRPEHAPMDRVQPWERLGLKHFEEEWCRIRIARPELSSVAIVRLIAGYSGRSPKMQSNIAHHLLHRPDIKARLAQLSREAVVAIERKKRYKLGAKNVLRTLASLAFTDIRDLVRVGEDGRVSVLPSDEWPTRAAAAVASIVNSPDGPKVTLHSKVDALGKLAKMLKLLPDDPIAPSPLHIGKAVIYIPSNSRPLQRAGLKELDVVPDPDDTNDAKEEHANDT